MDRPSWAPDGVDINQPSSSRIYDYLLGGSHNFAADRAVAEQIVALEPRTTQIVHANRAFLRRAVSMVAGAGVEQFLDIGSGVPTVGNVHEIAQKINPAARVVYVDLDPVAVAHARAILADNDRAGAIQADLRQPDTILGDPTVRELLDFSRPVGVLMVSMLHFIPDADDPHALIANVRDAVTAGSHLVISHLTWPTQASAGMSQAREEYTRAVSALRMRSPEEIAELFDGLMMVPPGLVNLVDWRPEQLDRRDSADPPIPVYAGVAVKTH